jgi:hypothetical protein
MRANYYGTDSANGYIDQQKYVIKFGTYKTGAVIERINCINTWGGPSLSEFAQVTLLGLTPISADHARAAVRA